MMMPHGGFEPRRDSSSKLLPALLNERAEENPESSEEPYDGLLKEGGSGEWPKGDVVGAVNVGAATGAAAIGAWAGPPNGDVGGGDWGAGPPNGDEGGGGGARGGGWGREGEARGGRGGREG